MPLVSERRPLEVEETVKTEEEDVGGQQGCMNESKKLWEIAGPAILASVSEFSISFVTAAFVGHLGELEFAAVSVSQNVIEGFVYGIMASIKKGKFLIVSVYL